MSTGAAAPRDPRTSTVPRGASSAVPMGVLLAAGAAAAALSTPPGREPAGRPGAGPVAEAGDRGPGRSGRAAREPEAA
ncbi:hypothetical protein [Streptomyces sp. NPDC101206]|uniref:hypothetical protein n=1 Tax=Streptomyces sp. NPDC101206 TaxID=3366128 RepID=UPI0037FE18EC